MSINKYRPHVHVLLEDDANRQIVNGFLLNPHLNARAIQVLPPAGGWSEVVKLFREVHVPEMRRYPERRFVLIIDFDNQIQRLASIKTEIPPDLSGRVFVLGVLSCPEALKADMRKTFEDIGRDLAQDCVDDARRAWGHDLLRHNETELDLMDAANPSIRQLLFS